MYKVHFTPEALGIMVPEQQEQISEMVNETVEKIEVFVDFSLPTGYLGLIMHYHHGNTIYGGMDKEGVLST